MAKRKTDITNKARDEDHAQEAASVVGIVEEIANDFLRAKILAVLAPYLKETTARPKIAIAPVKIIEDAQQEPSESAQQELLAAAREATIALLKHDRELPPDHFMARFLGAKALLVLVPYIPTLDEVSGEIFRKVLLHQILAASNMTYTDFAKNLREDLGAYFPWARTFLVSPYDDPENKKWIPLPEEAYRTQEEIFEEDFPTPDDDFLKRVMANFDLAEKGEFDYFQPEDDLSSVQDIDNKKHNPLEARVPNVDNSSKIGKTDAKDEGLVQEPRKQEPAKNAERFRTVKARAETTERQTKALIPHELTKFLAHAAAHPWDSNSGVRPSDHIKAQFAKWLGRGLSRTDIVAAQPNLAQAYATEINRYPERRVEDLVVRPHKLPPGAPRAPSMRPVAELSESEKAARREKKAAAQKRWRLGRQGGVASPKP